MWCETVGCDSPTGSVRSQMHASPSVWAAMRDSSRTRVGSPRALNMRARRAASATSSTPPVTGEQHALTPSRTGSSTVAIVAILPYVLTDVDVSTTLNASNDVDGRPMSDQDVRDHVRQRYAAAAIAVTAGGRDALTMVDADQCCGPSAPGENASCCGGGAEVDAAFGSALYSAAEQGELPAEAVPPVLAAAIRSRSLNCGPASACST